MKDVFVYIIIIILWICPIQIFLWRDRLIRKLSKLSDEMLKDLNQLINENSILRHQVEVLKKNQEGK